jgi:hypothetical protein
MQTTNNSQSEHIHLRSNIYKWMKQMMICCCPLCPAIYLSELVLILIAIMVPVVHLVT